MFSFIFKKDVADNKKWLAKRRLLGGLMLGALANSSFAISNIENERPGPPPEGFSGSLKVTFNGKTGNQQEQTFDGAFKGFYRNTDDIFMLLTERDWGTKLKITNKDHEFMHARWVHLLSDTWATEAFAQWEKDEFDRLASRVLTGGGARYTLLQKPDEYIFALGLGAFREYEKTNLGTYIDEQHLTRVNSYYSFKAKLSDTWSFLQTTYYQPSANKMSDYRVLADFGLGAKMTEKLQLRLNYRFTFDSEPAQNLNAVPVIDNHKTNTEYKTSLVYSF